MHNTECPEECPFHLKRYNKLIMSMALFIGATSCQTRHGECVTPVVQKKDAEQMKVMIASASDASFLVQMTKEEMEAYMPRAHGGDVYAINKMIQYYSQCDNEKQCEYWVDRRNEAKKLQEKMGSH